LESRANVWEYDSEHDRWCRFEADESGKRWMFAWIDIDEGYWRLEVKEESDPLRGYLSQFKGDIGKCMGHVDKLLFEKGVVLKGKLPEELSNFSSSYNQERKGTKSEMSQDSEGNMETSAGSSTFNMAMDAAKLGAGMAMTTKAQTAINELAVNLLKNMVGEDYATQLDHPLVAMFLSFGSPMFIHWLTLNFEGIFMGQEENIRAACKLAMAGQVFMHAEPALEGLKESLKDVAEVGAQVMKMGLISDVNFVSEKVKTKVKEKVAR